MPEEVNTTNNPPPASTSRLVKGTVFAIIAAAILLITVVLPAEYGIDPTGIGRATGLTTLAEPATTTIEIVDIIGGNEVIREVEIPDFGEPTPLPNPAVFQDQPEPAVARTMEITIPPGGETEIKTRLTEGKVILYSWQVDRGKVYIDFHGHDASFGPDFFVRYKEQQEGTGNNGSLTAPFTGEHGWYWWNFNDYPVVITLQVSGFYDEIIDYGIF